MNPWIAILIILGNFVLKITDDLQDEKDLVQYKRLVPLGLSLCYIIALMIITDKEGMLLTGSFALTSPIRKKTDNPKFQVTLVALFGSFLILYLISYFELIGQAILSDHFITFNFLGVFTYFVVAVIITHYMYEVAVPKIWGHYLEKDLDSFSDRKEKWQKFIHFKIITVVTCALPYHLLIGFILILGAISPLAYITSILSFFSYESAALVTFSLKNKMEINN